MTKVTRPSHGVTMLGDEMSRMKISQKYARICRRCVRGGMRLEGAREGAREGMRHGEGRWAAGRGKGRNG